MTGKTPGSSTLIDELKSALPRAVRLRAESLGASGLAWLTELPALLASVLEKWNCSLLEIRDGGSESLLVTVDAKNHGDAVIKLGLPASCDCANEARILRLAGTKHYVTLLDHDEGANALLLERLGGTLASLKRSGQLEMETIAMLMGEAWQELDHAHGMMTGAEKADWLADFISTRWRSLGQPCAERTVARALEYAGNRSAAHDPEHSVLVHGDAHQTNTLEVPHHQDSFKFIDPDGLFAEPAVDLAVLMRDWNRPLLEGNAADLGIERSQWLGKLTGADEDAIWQWGFMERVSTGLVMMEIGLHPEGREMLQIADAWAEV